MGKPLDAALHADALIVLTEWKNYKSPNLRALRDALRSPLVLDGRNIYDPHSMAAVGLTYIGIGRNNLALLAPQQRVRPAGPLEAAEPTTASDKEAAGFVAQLATQAAAAGGMAGRAVS